MNKADRMVLSFLAIGVWGILGSYWIESSIADADTTCSSDIYLEDKHHHNTNDIYKFKWKVRRIVEDCSVTDEEILC